MLSKMFPQQGKTVPEIRFKGFTGDWEEIKLGDKVPVRGGFAFKSTCFRKKGIPILKISNILPSGEVGGNFDYYDEIEQDISISLPNNSAVIAMSGATTGKVSILKISENEKVYQNQRVGYFENKNLIDYSFISILVKSSLFERKMKSVLVAGAQPNVSPKEIDSFEFLIPKDKKEQKKIGEYFISLDELIINYDIQILKLQNIKKSFLAKMFI
jgi:type I restriction enzyme S subunit